MTLIWVRHDMLEIQNVTTGYLRAEVLHSLSLEIKAGETVALLGPNGAGKTTLVSAVAGILPIWSGRVTLGGDDITKLRAEQVMKRGVVLVPSGRMIFGPLTVRENLLLGGYGRYRMLGKAAQAEQMDYVLELFPILKDRLASRGGVLSGGQQQMLAIGRALMARPSVLLLDEPTLGLAPLIVERLFETLRILQRDGLTMLLVEQNARLALEFASRAYILDLGRIGLSGRSKELLENPQVRNLYLGGSSEPESVSQGH
ncbi:MAG: ABC transporter ATP-binding protein [Candidatus Limnocylindrales bacterium]